MAPTATTIMIMATPMTTITVMYMARIAAMHLRSLCATSSKTLAATILAPVVQARSSNSAMAV